MCKFCTYCLNIPKSNVQKTHIAKLKISCPKFPEYYREGKVTIKQYVKNAYCNLRKNCESLKKVLLNYAYALFNNRDIF
jgi:hypothetical protein